MDRLEKLQQELQEEKNSRKRLMRQNKSLARQYVEFRQQLTAANARVAELEKKSHEAFISSSNAIGFYTIAKEGLLKHEESLVQRAEQAEAKVKRLIKKLTYNTPTFRDGECDEDLLTIDENEFVPLKSCMCDRLKQAEAQNKRMQTAINRYVIGNIDLLDALKAALEGKP